MQFLPRNCQNSAQRTYRNIAHHYNLQIIQTTTKTSYLVDLKGPYVILYAMYVRLSSYGLKPPGTYNRQCKIVQEHHGASFRGTTFTLPSVLHSAGLTQSSPKDQMGSFPCTIGPMIGDLVKNHNKNRYNYCNGYSNKFNTQKFVINLNDYSMETKTNKGHWDECSEAGVKQHSIASLP